MPAHRKVVRKKNGNSRGDSTTAAILRNATRHTGGVQKGQKKKVEERTKMMNDREFWDDLAQRPVTRSDSPPSTPTDEEIQRNRDRLRRPGETNGVPNSYWLKLIRLSDHLTETNKRKNQKTKRVCQQNASNY